ncbi:MAG TPA: SRPBCC domain-containing protein [Candidatus Dormibacteraeota bacterium]|nr:SRPBCC domain-containing protein [Candidatus Dormibacteraeota bacterium]
MSRPPPKMPSRSGRNNDDLVFRALADPTRRQLLDALFDYEGRTLTALDAQVKGMTRFGVMKHLRILEAAGLVATRKEGREKFHYLNPVPVQLIHDRWVSKYTRPRAEALADLKDELERRNRMAGAPRQVFEIFIRATPEEIWDAITKPEFTAKYFFGSRVQTNGKAGSPVRHYAPDGTTLWGDDNVLESVPPRRFVHTWRSLYDAELAAEPASRVTWEIEPQPGGVTKLTVVHDELENSPKTAASVSGGWMFVISGLKTLLETGRPLAERSTGAQ